MLLTGLALRPAGRERLAAISTDNRTAQDKVGVDVLARGHARTFAHAFLNALILLKGNQALVVAFAQRDAPFGNFDVTGIVRTRQKAEHIFIAQFCAFSSRHEFRAGFQKALYLALRFQAARCKALKSFLNNRSHRLVADEQIAVAADPRELIAGRRMETPITTHRAGTHPVLGLLGVLTAIMLGVERLHALKIQPIGILPELQRRAIHLRARRINGIAQVEMRANVARQAADVIEHDDILIGMFFALEELHDLLDAGTVEQFA